MQGEIQIIPLLPVFLQLVDTYVRHHLKARNLTTRTCQNIQQGIIHCLLFLQHKLKLTDLTKVEARHLEAYVIYLEKKGYAVATRRRKLIEIRDFFTWLKRDKHIPHNPAQHLHPPRTKNIRRRILSKAEYQQRGSIIADARDYALVELLLHTGITLSEVHRLNYPDVVLPADTSVTTTGLMWATDSTRHRRLIYLNAKACTAVAAWLVKRPFVATDALFVSQKEKRLSLRQIQYTIEKYVDAAGLENVNVQTLRNTFAVHHLHNDTPLEFLQEVLGLQQKTSMEPYVEAAQWMEKGGLS